MTVWICFLGPCPPKSKSQDHRETQTPYIMSRWQVIGGKVRNNLVFLIFVCLASPNVPPFLSHFPLSLFSFLVNLSSLSFLFLWKKKKKCQINRNVTSKIRSLLLYLPIEVPSCLSLWQLLLTSDVFFESESAFFGSVCYTQQGSVRVKLSAALYTNLLLPPAITKLVIHNIVNPASFLWK